MSRFKQQRAKQLYENNKKVRYRMYKSRKRWLIAGTSSLSGVVAGLFVSSGAVMADTTQTVTAKSKDLLVNQRQTTLPSGSDSNDESSNATTNQTDSNSTSQAESTTESQLNLNNSRSVSNQVNASQQSHSETTSTISMTSYSQSQSEQQEQSTSGSSTSTSTSQSYSNSTAEVSQSNSQAEQSMSQVTDDGQDKREASETATDHDETSVSNSLLDSNDDRSDVTSDSESLSTSSSQSASQVDDDNNSTIKQREANQISTMTLMQSQDQQRPDAIVGDNSSFDDFMRKINDALRKQNTSLADFGMAMNISDALRDGNYYYDELTGTVHIKTDQGWLNFLGELKVNLYIWDPNEDGWQQIGAQRATPDNGQLSFKFDPRAFGFQPGDTMYFNVGIDTTGLAQFISDKFLRILNVEKNSQVGRMITDANEDYQNNVGGKATASFSNVCSQFLQNRDVIDSSLSTSASASLGTSLVTSLSTSMSASYGSQVVTPSQSAEFSSLSTSISDSLIGSANSSLSQSESFSREADSQQDDSISASISNSESREQSINDEQASYSDSIEADRHFLLNSTNRNSVIASQSFSLQKSQSFRNSYEFSTSKSTKDYNDSWGIFGVNRSKSREIQASNVASSSKSASEAPFSLSVSNQYSQSVFNRVSTSLSTIYKSIEDSADSAWSFHSGSIRDSVDTSQSIVASHQTSVQNSASISASILAEEQQQLSLSNSTSYNESIISSLQKYYDSLSGSASVSNSTSQSTSMSDLNSQSESKSLVDSTSTSISESSSSSVSGSNSTSTSASDSQSKSQSVVDSESTSSSQSVSQSIVDSESTSDS
ncbi:KxYKxGKxW signal peptide domain-containing protein, partial [Fructilactobacillus florum]|uniref:KxYKxGKxW signal peptide domain-containing protein n=1 Tax=Fructilactobacillus florum TaxID=640331 RepID=UPI0005911254